MSFSDFLAEQADMPADISKLIIESLTSDEVDQLGGVDHIVECLEGRDPNDLSIDLTESRAGNLKGIPKTWLRFAVQFGAGKESEVIKFKKGVKGVKTIVTHLRAAAKDPYNAAFYLVQGGEPFALVVKDGYGKKEYRAILPDGKNITRAEHKRQKTFTPRGQRQKYRMVTFTEPDLSLSDIADRLAFTDDYEQLIPVDIIIIKGDVDRAMTKDRRSQAKATQDPGTAARAMTKLAKRRLETLVKVAVDDVVEQLQGQLTAVMTSPETFSGFNVDLDAINKLTSKISRITRSLQSAIDHVNQPARGNNTASNASSSRPGYQSGDERRVPFSIEVFLDALKNANK